MIKKKGLIFLIAILLFGIIFVNDVKADFFWCDGSGVEVFCPPKLVQSTCISETDNGFNVGVKGEVSVEYVYDDGSTSEVLYIDGCVDGDTVNEFYCNNEKTDALSTDQDCANGFECKNGACVPPSVSCSISGGSPLNPDGIPVRNVGDPANIKTDISGGVANKEYTLINSYGESEPKFESKITTDSSGSFSKLNQEIIPSTYVTGLYNAKLKIGQTPSGFLITTSCGRFYVCGQGEKWDSSSGKCISTITPTCGNENQNCCSSRAEPGLLTCSQGLTCVNQKCVAGAACDTNNFPTRPCNFNNGCYQECGSKKYLCVDVQRTGFKWTEWLSLFKSYSSTECSTNACTQYNFPSSCTLNLY